MKDYVAGTTLAIGIIIGLFVGFLMVSLAPAQPVPYCHEDEIVVGIGEFSGGYWSDYSCRHIDMPL